MLPWCCLPDRMGGCKGHFPVAAASPHHILVCNETECQCTGMLQRVTRILQCRQSQVAELPVATTGWIKYKSQTPSHCFSAEVIPASKKPWYCLQLFLISVFSLQWDSVSLRKLNYCSLIIGYNWRKNEQALFFIWFPNIKADIFFLQSCPSYILRLSRLCYPFIIVIPVLLHR